MSVGVSVHTLCRAGDEEPLPDAMPMCEGKGKTKHHHTTLGAQTTSRAAFTHARRSDINKRDEIARTFKMRGQKSQPFRQGPDRGVCRPHPHNEVEARRCCCTPTHRHAQYTKHQPPQPQANPSTAAALHTSAGLLLHSKRPAFVLLNVSSPKAGRASTRESTDMHLRRTHTRVLHRSVTVQL